MYCIVLYCIVLIICLWRRVNDFNPTFALAAETILLVSDYINCIAVLCLNKYVCMYV